jgi:RNA polymerase sigma-70 factor (ECF subfamily)
MDEQLDRIDTKELRAGDKNAVRQWFERYADPLYTLVYHRLGRDADAAQDVVQETFLTALKNIEDYQPARGSMFSWLGSLSRNCIKKVLKQRNRHASYQTDYSSTDGVLLDACAKIATQPLPQDVLQRAETADLVRIALESIPRHYANVLRQYYYERLSVEQISKSHAASHGATRVLLHRARETFRQAFLNLLDSQESNTLQKGKRNDRKRYS